MDRRTLIRATGALAGLSALEACTPALPPPPSAPVSARVGLAPVRASPDRITRITVCTRPFRPAGPRFDIEPVGHKLVIHNYGHGGSGWSLSWGSAQLVVGKALAQGATDIAVIGCGALGLTSALAAQRAGLAVTIYAKEIPPDVRSSLATGVWSPDSRIALETDVAPGFSDLWQTLSRTSFKAYQDLVGLAGDPVQWYDRYDLRDPKFPLSRRPGRRFASFYPLDLVPLSEPLAPDQHPFDAKASRTSTMMFNLPAYQRLLMGDFLSNGGRIRIREFHTPHDLGALRERVLINATGYGAKALFGDPSLIPVRGQLAHLVPQPEVTYGLTVGSVSLVPRRDGLIVQSGIGDDDLGYGDDTTVADRGDANVAVAVLADVAGRMRR